MDRIILPEIKFTACHGVYDEEKITPQPFCMSVVAELDLGPAGRSDRLAESLHYGELYQSLYELGTENSFDLIETLAERAAQIVLADTRVQRARVRVEKSRARQGEFCFPAQVEVERSR